MPYNSFKWFYLNDYVKNANDENQTIRSRNTIKKWLKELKIKLTPFDRYRCEICFNGKTHLTNQRLGKIYDQDEITKFENHQKLYRNQYVEVKKDKQLLNVNIVTIVYDYATFHEYSKEKVSFPFLFFSFLFFSFQFHYLVFTLTDLFF